MPSHSYDEIVKLLIAYWQGSSPTDPRKRHRCRQVADMVIQHLPAGISQGLRSAPQAYEAEIRDALVSLMKQGGPGVRKLIRGLAEPRQKPARQQVTVTGTRHTVITIGGDVSGNVTLPDRRAIDQQVSATLGRTASEQAYLTRLHQILNAHFDEEELRTLCFNLNVDFDSLPVKGKANKARELVTYLERLGRISELVEIGKRLRPNVSWEKKPL